jgi:hypothetical protein
MLPLARAVVFLFLVSLLASFPTIKNNLNEDSKTTLKRSVDENHFQNKTRLQKRRVRFAEPIKQVNEYSTEYPVIQPKRKKSQLRRVLDYLKGA